MAQAAAVAGRASRTSLLFSCTGAKRPSTSPSSNNGNSDESISHGILFRDGNEENIFNGTGDNMNLNNNNNNNNFHPLWLEKNNDGWTNS